MPLDTKGIDDTAKGKEGLEGGMENMNQDKAVETTAEGNKEGEGLNNGKGVDDAKLGEVGESTKSLSIGKEVEALELKGDDRGKQGNRGKGNKGNDDSGSEKGDSDDESGKGKGGNDDNSSSSKKGDDSDESKSKKGDSSEEKVKFHKIKGKNSYFLASNSKSSSEDSDSNEKSRIIHGYPFSHHRTRFIHKHVPTYHPNTRYTKHYIPKSRGHYRFNPSSFYIVPKNYASNEVFYSLY